MRDLKAKQVFACFSIDRKSLSKSPLQRYEYFTILKAFFSNLNNLNTKQQRV